MKLSIIIPVYNEDDNIVALIKKLKKQIDCSFEILICFDFDEDSSLNHINNQTNEFKKNIIFIKNPSIGPNSAIKYGISKSQSEIIMVYMADDFSNIKLINELIAKIEQGFDLVIPSRFIAGGNFEGAEPLKQNITKIGSFLVKRFALLPFSDSTNAFKMFNSKLAKKIKLDSQTGFTFAIELTIKSYIAGNKIIEVPAQWIEIEGRKSNFKVLRWLPSYIYWLFYGAIQIRLNKIKKVFKF